MIVGLDRRIRPPRLGTIGLGIKVGSGAQEHAQEVRYFVVAPEVAKVYGEQPTTLPVRFPWNEPEQVLHSIYYEQRRGRVKVRQCDGRMFTEIRSGGKDVWGDCLKAKDPDNLYAPCEFGCRARARLSVLVPKTRLGIWEIRMGGLGRIADLMAELRLYRAAIGPLSQFPFEIERMETEEQYFSNEGPRWRKGYPVRLRSPYTLEEVAALHEAQGVQAALPPAPHDEDVVDTDEDEANGGKPRSEPVQPVAPPPASPAGRTEPDLDPPLTFIPPDRPPDGGDTLTIERPRTLAQPAAPEPLAGLVDVSMCYKWAAECGMTPELYERYFEAHHGVRTGDAPDAVVAREAAEFRALGSESDRLAHKATLIRRLNEALKAKGARR